MPRVRQGKFHTRPVRQGFWKRLFSDRAEICDATHRVLATVQFNPGDGVLYKVELGPRELHVPQVKGSPNTAIAYLREGEEELASVSPGQTWKQQRVNFAGKDYLLQDTPALLRHQELLFEEKVLARSKPAGVFKDWPQVELEQELELELIVLLFLLFRGVVRNRGATA